jgi:hypothetical protein
VGKTPAWQDRRRPSGVERLAPLRDMGEAGGV